MDRFVQEILEIKKRLSLLEETIVKLRRIVFPDGKGKFQLPRYAGNPSSLQDGDMWLDTTNNQVKVRVNGVVKIVNLT